MSKTQTRLISELQELIANNPGITVQAIEHIKSKVAPKDLACALRIGKSKEIWNMFDGGYYLFQEVPKR